MIYDMDSSKQLDSAANSDYDYPIYQEPLLNDLSSNNGNTQVSEG